MSEIRKCSKCGNEIAISESLATHSDGMDILCTNRDEHANGEVVIMWRQGGMIENV